MAIVYDILYEAASWLKQQDGCKIWSRSLR